MDCHHNREKELAAQQRVNDYFPEIIKFHENELLHFLDQLNRDYLVERKRRFSRIQSSDEALAYIREVRASFAACLGELPGSNPIRSEVVSTLDMGRYQIDNVLVEALPGYYLNASFYYPKAIKQPSPAILFLCGHAPEGKAYSIYVSFCIEAVLNGFCVLTFDPVGHGERRMYDRRDSVHFNGSPDTVHYLLGQQAWLVGDSITAFMMRDNITALDYLCSRKEADGNAVAVVGNSGGGHMAAFMGAYDERVAAVVSSCYITELSSMIHHIGAQECEQSMQGFMERGLDLADLVIAAAPKPYFIGASLMDFFPIDGTRDAYLDDRKIYMLLGRQENLEIQIAPKPHGFWWETREKALRFLCRQFAVPFVEDKGIDYGSLPTVQELRCLESGDINTYNAVSLQQMICRKACETIPCLPVIQDEVALASFSREMSAILRSVLKIDLISVKAVLDGVSSCYNDENKLFVSEYTFYSEQYMRIHATLYEKERGPKSTAVLHVGRLEPGDARLAELLARFPAVFCVETRGTGRGAVTPGCYFYEPDHFENEEASYCCAALMQGRSMAGMRVLDVLSAEKLLGGLKDFCGSRISLSGDGEDALTALYAAVVLGGRDVRLHNLLCSLQSLVGNRMYLWGPSTFAYGMLRHTDIPCLLASLMSNSVRVYGFLDHMKRPADASVLEELAHFLDGLGRIGGGSLDIWPGGTGAGPARSAASGNMPC